MRKIIAVGLLTAFLAGCNIQTVQQYDEEKERLANEQIVEKQVEKEESPQQTNMTQATTEEASTPSVVAKEKAHKETEELKKDETIVTQKTVIPVEKQQEQSSKRNEAETQNASSKKTIVVKKESVSTTQKNLKKEPTSVVKKKDEKKAAVEKKKDVVATKKKDETTSKKQEQTTTSSNTTNVVTTKPKQDAPIEKPDTKEYAFVSVRVDTLLKEENYALLPEGIQSEKYVPSDGAILNQTKIAIEEGDTAWTVTRKALQMNSIHVDYTGATETKYGSIYVKGIQHIYERQAGSLSGWMYAINGKAPNVGVSSYEVKKNDRISWQYTVNLGKDIGY